jgi:hypothetical protein
MKKIVFIIICIFILVISDFYYLSEKTSTNTSQNDYKNISYNIDGQVITLNNGLSSIPIAPLSASNIVTQYFGNDLKIDLNGDGREDIVFLLTQSTGGSGTFFYVVPALNTVNGYVSGKGLLLGDRIAPQTTNKDTRIGVFVVNYADRKVGEDFTVAPSVGKSIWLKLDTNTMQFGEVVQNFEGEGDLSRLIQVTSPLTNQKVASPLKITGRAIGNWYFEASFPIKITDANGKLLGQTSARALSDWMVTSFVPFDATITFTNPTTSTGFLILKNDNPSGDSAKDISISIPIKF